MYLALYRKYRPRTFDDVISQEHITTTLKNQIINNSAGHAYLFTGSRGTGKTTCAKIFSMAVNCEHPENGSPCMKCERCLEILEGTTPDVVEMDAASNRGVEDVRRLREEVVYTPVTCKYRVYIIDEVHMLTTEAFNALLKTLEEPPPHVKFILATTELHKVPATISSRCQRFEFRRVDIGDSAGRLMDVAEKEGFTLDHDAAELISRLSDGGMRDALSVLDRCASSDEHITVKTVRDCAGIADNRHLFEFSEMIAARNTAGCLRLLGELHKGAKDISLIINNLIEHYRDIMVCKTAPAQGDLLFAMPDERERLFQLSGLYSMDEVLDCITLLCECADNIGRTKQRKTLAEMCLVKMCARGSGSPVIRFDAISSASAVTAAENIGQGGFAVEYGKSAVSPAVVPTGDNAVISNAFDNKSKDENIDEKNAVNDSKSSDKTLLLSHSGSVPEPPPWDDEPAHSEILPAEQFPPIPPDIQNAADYALGSGIPPEPVYEPPFDAEPPTVTPPIPSEHYSDELSGDDYPISTAADNPEPELRPFAPITTPQWQTRIEEIAATDFMLGGMLRDSSIRCADNTVTITSSNSMLLNNVVGDELTRVEQKLNKAFGMLFHIRIEQGGNDFEEDGSTSVIEGFIEKARKLGVTVTIKD